MLNDECAVILSQVLIENQDFFEKGEDTKNRSVKPLILQHLDISDNLISQVGGLAIYQVIKKNWSLVSLNVCKNFIDAEAGSSILKFLK